jgi:hypothetical protein
MRSRDLTPLADDPEMLLLVSVWLGGFTPIPALLPVPPGRKYRYRLVCADPVGCSNWNALEKLLSEMFTCPVPLGVSVMDWFVPPAEIDKAPLEFCFALPTFSHIFSPGSPCTS